MQGRVEYARASAKSVARVCGLRLERNLRAPSLDLRLGSGFARALARFACFARASSDT